MEKRNEQKNQQTRMGHRWQIEIPVYTAPPVYIPPPIIIDP